MKIELCFGSDGSATARSCGACTHGVAGTLIAIAAEWVKAPADMIAVLKKLRAKLGTLPSGLTPPRNPPSSAVVSAHWGTAGKQPLMIDGRLATRLDARRPQWESIERSALTP
jgi:hypothetical protein